MMSKSFDGIFYDLTIRDFEILIQDLNLKKLGVEVHYVVDAHDVLEYCFPWGLAFQHENKSFDRIGDEQLAYYFLFFQNRPILLDEYKAELDSASLRAITGKGPYLLERFLKQYNSLDDLQKEDLLLDVQNNLSFLVSSVIYDAAPLTFYETLLMKSLLATSESPRNTDLDSDELYNLFAEIKPTNKSKEWLDKWYNRNFTKFVGKGYSDAFDIIQRSYRDFRALERIMRANQKSSQRAFAAKHLFLYFSSAAKSEEFLSSKSEIQTDIEMVLSDWRFANNIDIEISTSILRKQKHAYLLFLSQPKGDLSTEARIDEWILNLTKIQDFKKSYDLAAKEERDKIASNFREWRMTNLSYARELENELVVKQAYNSSFHERFKKGKDIAYNFLQERNFEPLRIYLQNLFDEHKPTSRRGLEKTFATVETSFSLQTKFSDILSFLESENRISITAGTDYIVGSFHILPTLLYYRQTKEKGALKKFPTPIDLILEISEFIGMSKVKKDENMTFLIAKIKTYLSRRESRQNDYQHQTKLLNLFLLQIAPFENKTQANIRENSIEFINDYYNVFEKISSVPTYNAQIQDWSYIKKEEDLEHEVEILYVKAWFERRNALYDDTILTCRRGIALRRHDPRFIHGICLAEYCKYIQSYSFIVDDVDRLEKISRMADEAIDLYYQTLKEPYPLTTEKLLQGNLIALVNLKRRIFSLMFILTLYYGFEYTNVDLLQQINTLGKTLEVFANEFDESLLSEPEMLRPTYLATICEHMGNIRKEGVNKSNIKMQIEKNIQAYRETFETYHFGEEKYYKKHFAEQLFEKIRTYIATSLGS